MRGLLAFLFVLCAFPRSAHAYIDPASGSIIVSAIISAIVAVSVAVRSYWAKIKAAISGQAPEKNEQQSVDES
tara:strand:+ start:271 stop:489 length:219 start_codon:yes stop_codon:yes gene_type:complete